ncbi:MULTISPECIES: hypothetical protein [Stenotrophomonas]|uniref:Uncharacterized protein n=1 Tax=Stenotrophomonas maltophilia TaxID=40324 RepID=A0A3S0HIE9_STEMA|nr:hypothetical protein [Stenotrophomonas maltophilia]RTQ89976.1 hypothetical protein EKL94_07895 [Stenotrophomonas maltophilia]
MNASDDVELRVQYTPANTDDEDAATPDPHNLIGLLDQIGCGAVADGQPWPERPRAARLFCSVTE